jgi:hypothetical protein
MSEAETGFRPHTSCIYMFSMLQAPCSRSGALGSWLRKVGADIAQARTGAPHCAFGIRTHARLGKRGSLNSYSSPPPGPPRLHRGQRAVESGLAPASRDTVESLVEPHVDLSGLSRRHAPDVPPSATFLPYCLRVVLLSLCDPINTPKMFTYCDVIQVNQIQATYDVQGGVVSDHASSRYDHRAGTGWQGAFSQLCIVCARVDQLMTPGLRTGMLSPMASALLGSGPRGSHPKDVWFLLEHGVGMCARVSAIRGTKGAFTDCGR